MQRIILLGRDDIFKVLVTNGADINAHGGHYGSLLHAAVQRGEEKIVQFLIENGASINVLNNSKESALHVAVQRGLRGW